MLDDKQVATASKAPIAAVVPCDKQVATVSKAPTAAVADSTLAVTLEQSIENSACMIPSNAMFPGAVFNNCTFNLYSQNKQQ